MYGVSKFMQAIQIHYKKKEESDFQDICITLHMSQLMRLWYLSHRRPAKAQAHPRSLTRAFTVRTHKVWKKTKNQTSSPTGWLHMRV